jgi:hypothetical protein
MNESVEVLKWSKRVMVKVGETPERGRGGGGGDGGVPTMKCTRIEEADETLSMEEESMLGEGILDGNLTVADESLVDYGMRTKREREFG